MEEYFDSMPITESKVLGEESTYGYAKEIREKQLQNRIGGEGYEDFDKMKTLASRTEAVEAVYYGLDEKMKNLFNSANQSEILSKFKDSVERKELYQGQNKEIERVEKYSLTGIFDHVNELSYEYRAAEKCKQRNSTKHSRKRVEKRKKALAMHKAAVMANADAAYVRFEKLGLVTSGIGQNGDTSMISENNKKDAYESFERSFSAKQELISSVKDAEDYDTENNLKMKRVGKKRVIDMGRGTTEFFQKLAKIRTDMKVYDISKGLFADYTSFTELVPQNIKRRFEQKSTRANEDQRRKNEKILSDINSIADRIPDLICALKQDADEAMLKGLVAQFKTSDAEFDKKELVNTIMTAPQILACIRKDMSDAAVPTDFVGLADTLINSFTKIAAKQPKAK